ncbi:hypothetical protein HID58_033794, partial [Brassica napus]
MAISSIKLDGLSLILAPIAGGGYVSDVVRMPPYICSVFPIHCVFRPSSNFNFCFTYFLNIDYHNVLLALSSLKASST